MWGAVWYGRTRGLNPLCAEQVVYQVGNHPRQNEKQKMGMFSVFHCRIQKACGWLIKLGILIWQEGWVGGPLTLEGGAPLTGAFAPAPAAGFAADFGGRRRITFPLVIIGTPSDFHEAYTKSA